ncbi:hypothetical protein ACIP5Y_35115 [Nocardia sp. NPDC088792]|uniref:hypothetical protein n=1 Tax=Nocardia sp. NPDC088792 TaxID=3364332 RepID=UPI0037FD8E9C
MSGDVFDEIEELKASRERFRFALDTLNTMVKELIDITEEHDSRIAALEAKVSAPGT